MPYKNPEDKRRWEHEHRDKRNARRRQRHSVVQSSTVPVRTLDPVAKGSTSGWAIFASAVVGIGIMLLTVLAEFSDIDRGA